MPLSNEEIAFIISVNLRKNLNLPTEIEIKFYMVLTDLMVYKWDTERKISSLKAVIQESKYFLVFQWDVVHHW